MSNIFRNRIFLRAIGIVLVFASLLAALGWFFWLVPMFQRFDPEWDEGFSRKTYWNEVQKRIQRYGWMHDDFGNVGDYGDESWAIWIMKRAEAGEKIGDCGSIGHKDSAMKFITGNNPAGTNSIVEPYWLSWWHTNKEKSQELWIQDGLRVYGVSVNGPATTNEYEPLLALIGNTATNETEKIPPFIRYNAFRWLRDSGFEAIPFALSNVTVQTSEMIRNGLIQYGKYEKVFSRTDGLGLLDFAPAQLERDMARRPIFFSAEVQIPAYLAMMFTFLIGIAVIFRSFRFPQAKAGK